MKTDMMARIPNDYRAWAIALAQGKAEVLTPYFGASGTGQINALFPVKPPKVTGDQAPAVNFISTARNEAAAWGARLSDVDYVPMFPITPQTEIIERLGGRALSPAEGRRRMNLKPR